jgi:hypothetical protein
MPAHLMAALFDGAAKAGAAADELVAMGLDRNAVHLIPQDGKPAAGVWDALAGLRLPAADRYGYAEAIRRGGVLLAVSATACADQEVVRALQEAGAVDLDEREDEWWSGGWRGHLRGRGVKEAASVTVSEPDSAVGHERLPGDARVRAYRALGPN